MLLGKVSCQSRKRFNASCRRMLNTIMGCVGDPCGTQWLYACLCLDCTVIGWGSQIVGNLHYDEKYKCPDSKVHGANMWPIWGRQDPDGPHVAPMNFVIWDGAGLVTAIIVKPKLSNLDMPPTLAGFRFQIEVNMPKFSTEAVDGLELVGTSAGSCSTTPIGSVWRIISDIYIYIYIYIYVFIYIYIYICTWDVTWRDIVLNFQ